MHFVFLALVLFFSHGIIACDTVKIMVPLEISGHALISEVANTDATRGQGLMYREVLEKDSGMLFVFPAARRYSMWMLNTNIPLSVAFLNEKGIILNILDMTPHTQTAHSSAGLAKYALEMNQGWFSARGIEAGEQVIGLMQAPAAIEDGC